MNPIFDPTIAYVLVVMAVFMSIVTFVLPGTGVPETITVLLIVAAWWVISNLVLNTVALGITLLSLVPMYFAFKNQKYQKLYLFVSLVLLIGGSVFLFVDKQGRPLVDIWIAVIVSSIFVLFVWLLFTRGVSILKAKSSMDPDTPVGRIGEARTDLAPKGSVYVNGELWSAKSDKHIREGQAIKVIDREGFTLIVTKAENSK